MTDRERLDAALASCEQLRNALAASQAECERLTEERDEARLIANNEAAVSSIGLAAVKATESRVAELEAEVELQRAAGETHLLRAESAESRVAELEAGVLDILDEVERQVRESKRVIKENSFEAPNTRPEVVATEVCRNRLRGLKAFVVGRRRSLLATAPEGGEGE